MKLPNGDRAIVDIQKLSDYCLNPHHPRGSQQSSRVCIRWIEGRRRGGTQGGVAWGRRQRRSSSTNTYGKRYTVDFELLRQGKTVRIRSTWIVLTGQELPRLTSCYVL